MVGAALAESAGPALPALPVPCDPEIAELRRRVAEHGEFLVDGLGDLWHHGYRVDAHWLAALFGVSAALATTATADKVWPGTRRLDRVVERPLVTETGEVIEAGRYEPADTLVALPSWFPAVPAKAPPHSRFSLDGPFAHPTAMAGYSALLYTTVARKTYTWPEPLFHFAGPEKACRDLVETAALVTTGREALVTFGLDDLPGSSFVLLDDASHPARPTRSAVVSFIGDLPIAAGTPIVEIEVAPTWRSSKDLPTMALTHADEAHVTLLAKVRDFFRANPHVAGRSWADVIPPMITASGLPVPKILKAQEGPAPSPGFNNARLSRSS